MWSPGHRLNNKADCVEGWATGLGANTDGCPAACVCPADCVLGNYGCYSELAPTNKRDYGHNKPVCDGMFCLSVSLATCVCRGGASLSADMGGEYIKYV